MQQTTQWHIGVDIWCVDIAYTGVRMCPVSDNWNSEVLHPEFVTD